jgi:hypothetical protein
MRSKTKKHINYEQEHEICKTHENEYYYANICKHEHEKTRLWCKIVLNKLKEMKGFIFIQTHLGT